MKIYYTLGFLLLFGFSFSQISTTRMNEMRINNTLPQIEKALGKKLEIARKVDDWLYTINISDKGSDLSLGFMESMDENDKTTFVLYEVKTKSTKIKTLSNLGVGSTLDELWKAYKNYNISVWQTWDEKTEKYSTTERVFQLNDHDASTAIYFYLRNDKVYEIVVTLQEGC